MSVSVEVEIRMRIAERSQKSVADALQTSTSSVSRFISGQEGVLIHRVGPLMEALGLAVITQEELSALRMFARRGIGD